MSTSAPSHSSAAAEAMRQKFDRYARTRDPELRAELAEAYLPLAASLAARFAGRTELLEDLEQAANLALVAAIERYDPTRGAEFTTFAWATISGELKRHLRDRAWAMRVPRRVQEHFLHTARAAEELQQELGRPPTVVELSRRTGLDQESTIEALEVRSLYRLPSLDAAARNDDDTAPGWEPGTADEAYDKADDADLLQRLLDQLNHDERRLLKLRFSDGLTQSEIAGRLGVSQMHISRMLTSLLARMRAMAAEV